MTKSCCHFDVMSVRVLFKWVEVEESGFVGDGVLAMLPLSAKNLAHDTSDATTALLPKIEGQSTRPDGCCLMHHFYSTNILIPEHAKAKLRLVSDLILYFL